MIKKRKKRAIYSIDQKNFNTFKEMKEFIWHNSHKDEEIEGFEIIDDEIQKHYIFIKEERKLICYVIYNKEKAYKDWLEHLQLKIFKDE